MPNLSASPKTQKADLRAAALARRDALSSEQRAAAAQAIATCSLPFEIMEDIVVSGYWPVRSEIDPGPLMQKLAAKGTRLALPVIIARDKPLLFRAWSPGSELARAALGLLEPMPDALEVIPDIVLVPLAAFDRGGHRIGYGAGYYDRTLESLRQSKKITGIGLAFAAQEIPEVPALAHDVRLDYVLTETGMVDCRSE